MLHLNPGPSRLRWLLALVSHALALLALFHAGAPPWLKLGLALPALASLWRELRQYRGRRGAAAMRLGANSIVLRVDGEAIASAPPSLPHCSEWLIVLEFPLDRPRAFHRRLRLTLFPDSLGADELRRLRRWLHYDRG